MFVRKLTVLCCVYAVTFLIVSAGFLNDNEWYELRCPNLDYKLKFCSMTEMILVLRFFDIC